MSDTSDTREPTYFILAALQDGPLHGYGIIKRTEVRSDVRLTLAAGTLYGALERLAETSLITVGPSYTEGSATLVAEARRLAQALRVVRIPAGRGVAAEAAR